MLAKIHAARAVTGTSISMPACNVADVSEFMVRMSSTSSSMDMPSTSCSAAMLHSESPGSTVTVHVLSWSRAS